MSGKNVTEVVLADAEGIAKAARILESGGLVAVPTETVYGLAARADSAEAVEKIYAAKGRPDFNPLIVHVAGLDQAMRYGLFTGPARVLADKAWPGSLTLVVPRRADAGLAAAVTAGLSTIAMRAPEHPVMQALLASVDFPIAAPSANRSGFISPTTADHVLASLDGRIDLVLDAGPCAEGVESTILLIDEAGVWHELRPGPESLFVLNSLYFDPNRLPEIRKGGGERGIEAPGQLASHYAPGKPVRLNVLTAEADEFLIGFGGVEGDCTLSANGDLFAAATRLYICLHEAARAPHLLPHHPNAGSLALTPAEGGHQLA
jgi:L-threonylcarbamoyladenylate synthase